MENGSPGSNPITETNQLPEADSLPNGFLGSTSVDPLALEMPKPEKEKLELTVCKEEKLVEPDRRRELVIDDHHLGKSPAVASESKGSKEKEETIASENTGSSCEEEKGFGKSHAKGSDSQVVDVKDTSSQESSGNTKKEASEVKQKNAKSTFNSETEVLEFTLKYRQVLADRDSAITIRDKLESLWWELQCQNEVLMDDCRRASTEGQNLRLDLSNKFQDALKEVSNKLEERKDICLSQLEENEMLKIKLKELAGQYTLSKQQYAQKLKEKTLELQLADLKLKQHEEKLVQEQSQMKLYTEQVSELLATEKNLRLQLTADGEKFQQFQEALLKSNEVFETFRQEIEKMEKSIKELRKENTFLERKCEKSDVSLTVLVKEHEHLKKQLEAARDEKEKLMGLCRLLLAELLADPTGSSGSAVVTG